MARRDSREPRSVRWALLWSLALAGCTQDVVLGARDPSAIVAGASHSCALDSRGASSCWGANGVGQLGDGTTATRRAPVRMLERVRAIAAGGAHGCALCADGQLLCWGEDSQGQLGDGSPGPPTLAPSPAFAIDGVVALAAGGFHSCALRAGGDVRCWGANTAGQLGDGTFEARVGAVEVVGLRDAVAIEAGVSSSCALRVGGAVVCWGGDARGQLGDGTDSRSSAQPVGVLGLSDVTAITLRAAHACALRSDGEVWCWGGGTRGELGDGAELDRAAPVRSALSPAVAFGSGLAHTCAVARDRTVRCVGANDTGQLGDASAFGLEPVQVLGIGGARAVAGGNDHTCALLDSGVRCWGSDSQGQLGDD